MRAHKMKKNKNCDFCKEKDNCVANKANEQNEEELNLSEELEKCISERTAFEEKYIRANADFNNFKNRTEKEFQRWILNLKETMTLDLLSISDDFERAFSGYEKLQKNNDNCEALLDGFKMIYKSLQKNIEKHQVKEIKDNHVFDPNLHEAIAHIDSEKHKSGEIVEVVQKGFKIGDKVLRAAKVCVAK